MPISASNCPSSSTPCPPKPAILMVISWNAMDASVRDVQIALLPQPEAPALPRRALRRLLFFDRLGLAVAKYAQREVRNHLLGDPVSRLDRILPPDRWAGRKNFDKREARAVALDFERLARRCAPS